MEGIYFDRQRELRDLRSILHSEKSEFLYLRGRRRVGKSWLLSQLTQELRVSFLFTGTRDATSLETKKIFIRRFYQFSNDIFWNAVSPERITWPEIFSLVGKFCESQPQKTTLIFDEVQWIANSGSGFIGALKEAWVPLQKMGKVNIIVCGSSNKFFATHVGGEEKILRGIQTRPQYWLQPLSPSDMKRELCPQWHHKEILLLFMMTGGIPYYLERIDVNKAFIQAVNDAFFLRLSNLLEEPREILSLDFNSLGVNSSLKVLSNISGYGSSHGRIVEESGLAPGTVSRILDKLTDYKIVFEKQTAFQKTSQKQVKYCINDLFLHFYFRVLIKVESRIKFNDSGLIFPSSTGLAQYYIPDYSGSGFELSLRTLLNNHLMYGSRLYEKLLLRDHQYEILDYWDKSCEVDMLIYSKEDRLLRIIECKWGAWSPQFIEDLERKSLSKVPSGVTVRKFILASDPPANKSGSKNPDEVSNMQGITVVSCDDFFA